VSAAVVVLSTVVVLMAGGVVSPGPLIVEDAALVAPSCTTS
jgi:hypothetical protein